MGRGGWDSCNKAANTCKSFSSDCNKVLNSAHARPVSWASWSDFGLIYFLGGSTSLVIGLQISDNVITCLAFLNIISIVFSFYSLWYQHYIIKQWCLFCLIVLLIFWIEFILFFISNTYFYANIFLSFIYIVLGFSSSMFFVFYWKKITKENNDIQRDLKKSLQIKLDNKVFEFLRKDFPHYAIDNSCIRIWGNEEFQNNITIVTNPFCKPCLKIHEEIDECINSGYFSNTNIDIVFAINIENEKYSEKYKIISTIISLYNHQDFNIARKALNDWYSDLSYHRWSIKYPFPNHFNDDTILKEHEQWCKKHKISYTPTIVFNSKNLPQNYDIHDLKFIKEM